MQQWCIPTVSAAFVSGMEAILDLYATPYDPSQPVVCVDESPFALTQPRRTGHPSAPGQVAKVDYEYERCGSCSLFAAFQPLTGWRTVQARERRTAEDFAVFLQELVDVHFPDAAVIHVVLDNLNTHHPHTLYQTYPAAEARRIARKLVFHKTPVHGSWLNMIEIEWSVLMRQCLRRKRLGDIAAVQTELDAWVAERNAAHATVDWRFTTSDARIVLDYLYPLPVRTAA